ncbi:MAG: tetratricopeptide repeat protein [Pleurocapsa sp.]
MSDSDFTIPISQSENSPQESRAEYGYKILEPGELLKQRYSIIKELGSGGFATTYLAIDTQSKFQVKCAVKQLQPRYNSPTVWANARERLATEGMVLQWLGNHSQIPQLLDHFEENQQFYLVLEFIEGEEFEQEVNRQVLDETQLINFLIDALEILGFVHQQGVIHRDIKPSNLIRRKKDGKITLIDFGAVKEIGTLAFDANKQRVKTQIIGTPGYMPPEQNNGKPLYSSDIYALGKTAIFALTGKSPTEWEETGIDQTGTWYDNISVSEALIAIIRKMTANKTAERYQNVLMVLQDLQPLLMVGKIIGNKYRIVKYLGGQPRIYAYAVSNLTPENPNYYYLAVLQARTQELSELFLRADQVITQLANLNKSECKRQIPQTIEYFTDECNLYLVQEYIDGESLAQIIRRHFVLSETEVVDILIDAGNILASIHKQKIIHGNIKPSSLIKRNCDGKIVLVDFGAIQEIIGLIPNNQTGYIAPEQIADRATYASDIYALGMSAIHILTGVSPQNLEKNPRTGEMLWQRKARISNGLARVLDKMICLDRKKRYQSASKVVKDLKQIKNKSKFKAWYKYFLIAPFLLGIILFALAHWAQRVAILEFYKADLRLEAKQYEQAIEYYDNGLRKLPKTQGIVRHFEQVWLKKAGALKKLNRHEESLQTCENALKYYQSYKLWNCKALALDSLKRYESAIAAYDQALELDENYLWAWNNRGEAYSELGKYDAATADFQRAIELDETRSYVPWHNLGKLNYRQRKYQRAVEAYEQALAVKKDYLPSVIGLGNAQKNLGRNREALESYDRALEIDHNSYEAWYGKGLVQETLRQYTAAIESYQKAFTIKPDWEIVIQALQRVERKLNN